MRLLPILHPILILIAACGAATLRAQGEDQDVSRRARALIPEVASYRGLAERRPITVGVYDVEADEFEDALSRTLAARRDGATTEATDWASALRVHGDGSADGLVRRGNELLLLIRMPRDQMVRVARRILEDTRRQECRALPGREQPR